MNPRMKTYCLLPVFVTLSTSASYASTIETVGVLTEASSSIQSLGRSFLSFATLSADVASASFTHDFSALGETQWTVTWQAATGQVFELTPPTGLAGVRINAQFIAASGSEPTVFSSASTTAIQFEAESPTFAIQSSSSSLSGPNGNLAEASATVFSGLAPGETYRFTSLSTTATVPDGFDVDFDIPVLVFQIEVEALMPPGSDIPGQWLRVVPEPTSLALLGMGGLIVCRCNRRSN